MCFLSSLGLKAFDMVASQSHRQKGKQRKMHISFFLRWKEDSVGANKFIKNVASKERVEMLSPFIRFLYDFQKKELKENRTDKQQTRNTSRIPVPLCGAVFIFIRQVKYLFSPYLRASSSRSDSLRLRQWERVENCMRKQVGSVVWLISTVSGNSSTSASLQCSRVGYRLQSYINFSNLCELQTVPTDDKSMGSVNCEHTRTSHANTNQFAH